MIGVTGLAGENDCLATEGAWVMAENSQPGRKLGPREFIGGFALMVMGFGAQSWSNGRDIPWGAQQTYGAVLFGVGLVAAAGACLWPRKKA